MSAWHGFLSDKKTGRSEPLASIGMAWKDVPPAERAEFKEKMKERPTKHKIERKIMTPEDTPFGIGDSKFPLRPEFFPQTASDINILNDEWVRMTSSLAGPTEKIEDKKSDIHFCQKQLRAGPTQSFLLYFM